ncbi:MAG: PmoA family protein [Sedimentisphaerales bacterium]
MDSQKKWVRLLFVLMLCSIVSAEDRSCKYILKTDSPLVASTPLYIDLEDVNFNTDTQRIALYRLDSAAKSPIPCQLETGHTARLWFMLDTPVSANTEVTYEIAFENARASQSPMTVSIDANTITLGREGKNILSYYTAIHDVPNGVSPLYRRSGFIHPLWSPAGNIMTCIQPPDHYHHYGIWNPWTKTQVEGKEVDFWNLAKGDGTVRFAGVLSTVSGPVYAGYKVRQEHVVLKPHPKVAMNEVSDVRAYAGKVNGKLVWLIDYTSIINDALETPINLDDYRYGGGIGYRATEKWNRDNSAVLTSEGKTRKDADGNCARWCDISGSFGDSNNTSGIVFFSHPANRKHPEPIRLWPPDVNDGNGAIFFNFCPIRIEGWSIEPQKEYTLRYRMIVYDGKIDAKTIEVLWQSYARTPVITRKIN